MIDETTASRLNYGAGTRNMRSLTDKQFAIEMINCLRQILNRQIKAWTKLKYYSVIFLPTFINSIFWVNANSVTLFVNSYECEKYFLFVSHWFNCKWENGTNLGNKYSYLLVSLYTRMFEMISQAAQCVHPFRPLNCIQAFHQQNRCQLNDSAKSYT